MTIHAPTTPVAAYASGLSHSAFRVDFLSSPTLIITSVDFLQPDGSVILAALDMITAPIEVDLVRRNDSSLSAKVAASMEVNSVTLSGSIISNIFDQSGDDSDFRRGGISGAGRVNHFMYDDGAEGKFRFGGFGHR
jgi:hypothetical protein